MDDFRLYRAQARSFERQAELARRSEARRELLDLARLWGQLADKAEHAERHGPIANEDQPREKRR